MNYNNLKNKIESFYKLNEVPFNFNETLLNKVVNFYDSDEPDEVINCYLIGNRENPLEEIIYNKIKKQVLSKLEMEGYSFNEELFPTLDKIKKESTEISLIGLNQERLESIIGEKAITFAANSIYKSADNLNQVLNSFKHSLIDVDLLRDYMNQIYDSEMVHEKIDYLIRMDKLISPLIKGELNKDILIELKAFELSASEINGLEIDDYKNLITELSFYEQLIKADLSKELINNIPENYPKSIELLTSIKEMIPAEGSSIATVKETINKALVPYEMNFLLKELPPIKQEPLPVKQEPEEKTYEFKERTLSKVLDNYFEALVDSYTEDYRRNAMEESLRLINEVRRNAMEESLNLIRAI